MKKQKEVEFISDIDEQSNKVDSEISHSEEDKNIVVKTESKVYGDYITITNTYKDGHVSTLTKLDEITHPERRQQRMESWTCLIGTDFREFNEFKKIEYLSNYDILKIKVDEEKAKEKLTNALSNDKYLDKDFINNYKIEKVQLFYFAYGKIDTHSSSSYTQESFREGRSYVNLNTDMVWEDRENIDLGTFTNSDTTVYEPQRFNIVYNLPKPKYSDNDFEKKDIKEKVYLEMDSYESAVKTSKDNGLGTYIPRGEKRFDKKTCTYYKNVKCTQSFSEVKSSFILVPVYRIIVSHNDEFYSSFVSAYDGYCCRHGKLSKETSAHVKKDFVKFRHKEIFANIMTYASIGVTAIAFILSAIFLWGYQYGITYANIWTSTFAWVDKFLPLALLNFVGKIIAFLWILIEYTFLLIPFGLMYSGLNINFKKKTISYAAWNTWWRFLVNILLTVASIALVYVQVFYIF